MTDGMPVRGPSSSGMMDVGARCCWLDVDGSVALWCSTCSVESRVMPVFCDAKEGSEPECLFGSIDDAAAGRGFL